MSGSARLLLFLLPFSFLASLLCRGSCAEPLTCPRSEVAGLVEALRSPQCPLGIERSFAEEVNGDILDKVLAHAPNGAYYSVFFYASRCPFSQNFRSTFDTLSSMFPQITHLALEQYSAMPSLFSRYGIHSFPAFVLASRRGKIRYHGLKDLDSLVNFYREITGEEPVAYFSMDQAKENTGALQPWMGTTKEFLNSEPYLAFSLLFVILRAFTYFFPKLISQIKSSWALYTRLHANLGIISGLNQLLGRVLQVIDAKKILRKLNLSSKTGNFHKGAKSARVWASSLASVSLGESSSPRLALSDS
ncbi:5'-adenylylsulfate reductase-like 5 [Phalaenopsis equestris]|uniref:5'-adenylylsulfate reductase-like 5 n=1 Tax=Phalaenopsis equestris TaxID=78828 RepID=UPI0009E1C252|nr:5'-adenylylsulfate reductase-like 5 [Phalaenopsis equestris]